MQGRMGAEGGGSSLANIIICSNCRTYLFKLLNVFVLNAKFISLTCKMYWVVQCRVEWGQKEAAALWQISAISHRKSGISLIYTDPSWNRYLQIILCKILHLFPTNVQHLTFISLVINSEEIGRVLCPVQDGIVK